MSSTRCAAALVSIAAAFGCSGLPPAPAPINPVRFILVNDVYVADTLSDGTGGLARVATVRDRLAAEGPVLFVLAGDVLSPSVLSKYYHGRQMVEAFNATRLDYATFGNHEFELDRDTLIARIAESRFTWLSANCTGADGAPFPGVLAWDTVRVHDQLLGLFGLTLTGAYRSYVRCTDPASAAHTAIDTLSAVGAQMIVGITHQSLAADRALLTREPRLDLILGGHEHEAHDATVAQRHVLKADANARTVQFATLWGAPGQWRQATRLLRMDGRIPLDSGTARVAAKWSDSLRQRLGAERVVGASTVTIDARDAPSRHRESVLGDLVTDAMRAGTGSDVALINAGTLRLDDVIPPGPVTNYQLESIFLFADETRVVTFALTGAGLRALLEHSVADAVIGTGGFLQVSGVTFTYDPSRASGMRVVGELRRPAGNAIRPADTLSIALDVYPACEGGDHYAVPEAKPACANWRAGPRAVDLLVAFITDSLRGTIDAPRGGRIQRAGENTNPDER